MRVDVIKVCKGKKPYDTIFEAEIIAAKANNVALHENIHAYKCPFCRVYHIGHKRVSKNKKVVETMPGKIRCPRCNQIIKKVHRDYHKINKSYCEKPIEKGKE